MKQLESGSKEIIKWNKYQSKVTEQKPNRYLDYIVDLDFQEVNRLFVLSFEKKKKKLIEKYTQDIIFQKYK